MFQERYINTHTLVYVLNQTHTQKQVFAPCCMQSWPATGFTEDDSTRYNKRHSNTASALARVQWVIVSMCMLRVPVLCGCYKQCE